MCTSAIGVGSDRFNGYYDNTDIALKIMAIMGIDPKVHLAAPTPLQSDRQSDTTRAVA